MRNIHFQSLYSSISLKRLGRGRTSRPSWREIKPFEPLKRVLPYFWTYKLFQSPLSSANLAQCLHTDCAMQRSQWERYERTQRMSSSYRELKFRRLEDFGTLLEWRRFAGGAKPGDGLRFSMDWVQNLSLAFAEKSWPYNSTSTMAPSRGRQPLARTLHVVLNNHKGPVNVARYSKGTAKYILTGGQDRTVRLWNANLGTEIKAFAAHGYEVLSITVYVWYFTYRRKFLAQHRHAWSSQDNAKFASSGGDRSIFVWDVATGTTTRRIAGHMGKIHVVEFNEDASVVASGRYCMFAFVVEMLNTESGSYDATVRLWDLRFVSVSWHIFKS